MIPLEAHAGLYVHIPFCKKKCRYCDFYSITDLSLEKPFIQALKKEIGQKVEIGLSGLSFDTLYFGGGTPSLLSVDALSALLEEIMIRFDFHENPEITIEVNPGTVTREKLAAYFGMGIRRLNIGVQSFNDANLEFLGRIHTAHEGVMAVEQARAAGFDNVGVDLIMGLPGQEKGSLEADLVKALSLHPEHISCYMLTYEQGTPLDQMRQRGKINPLEEETVGDLYEFLSDFLENRGYCHYEISNFEKLCKNSSKCSYRSQHNLKYWSSTPYIGIGPAAHSFIRPKRFWNVRDLKTYIEALAKGHSPMMEEETLSPEQERMEAIALRLRTREGIEFDAFRKRFGLDVKSIFEEQALLLETEGYLLLNEERLCLTRKGFLIADAITLKLIEALDRV